MQTVADNPQPQPAPRAGAKPPPFGVNEMRLAPREWLVTIVIVVAAFIAIPRLWKKHEPLKTTPDYRIPYALSKDYWLFHRRLEQDATGDRIPILGDSVIWGEYVRPDGTLPHFLNAWSEEGGRYLNCGVNGMFPLAMEGLIRDYGQPIRNRKVIVECNVLWMTSPKADLSQDKEEDFNHATLVPQFWPRIPSYRADANDRLSAVIGRHVPLFQWSDHLQTAYYDQLSIPQWTLEEDPQHPRIYPNAWKNPLAPLKAAIPGEPGDDPDRGPSSRRHKAWNSSGAEPTDFEWVDIDSSLQWQAFVRVVRLLRERGNDVLVILGPFNEHMIADDQLPKYHHLRETIDARLAQDQFTVIVPATLPSEQYADASHPLTMGYGLLARRILDDPLFKEWLEKKGEALNEAAAQVTVRPHDKYRE